MLLEKIIAGVCLLDFLVETHLQYLMVRIHMVEPKLKVYSASELMEYHLLQIKEDLAVVGVDIVVVSQISPTQIK